MSDLHIAAYNANVELVLEFLDAGNDPNEYDQSGYTPLLWAAFRGAVGYQLPVIQALIGWRRCQCSHTSRRFERTDACRSDRK